MLIQYGVAAFEPAWPEAVVCIGTFDGLHRGHQTVIGEAVAQARAIEAPCGLLTFDRHPASTIAPDRVPKVLALPAETLPLIEALGVDFAVVLAFDEALRNTGADAFLADILRAKLRAARLVVGHDFALGHDREGSAAWLERHIPTTVTPAFELDGERVSSSGVRRAIEAGELDRAADWLGRPYELHGLVVHGDKLGRALGFPTANLALSSNQALPPDGVYVAEADTPFGAFRAAASLGTRPALDGQARVLEAHLLRYPGDSLYGRPLALRLLARLRGQERFGGLDALAEAIAQDVRACERWPA